MTTVLIVDDHPVFRDGLAGLLATLADVEPTARSAPPTRRSTRSAHAPRRGPDGPQPARALGRRGNPPGPPLAPATAVLVVTMVDDDDSVLAALRAGARGYVLKGASAGEISAAIRTVAEGGAVFGAGIASRLAQPRRPRTRSTLGPDLTPREREVLAVRRRRKQQADRPHPRRLTQDRAEPRLPHPRQAAGRRPHPSRATRTRLRARLPPVSRGPLLASRAQSLDQAARHRRVVPGSVDLQLVSQVSGLMRRDRLHGEACAISDL